MDAFITHNQVISDYKEYLQSFININDSKILEYIQGETLVKNIIPEPLIQFNPSFEKSSRLFEDCSRLIKKIDIIEQSSEIKIKLIQSLIRLVFNFVPARINESLILNILINAFYDFSVF